MDMKPLDCLSCMCWIGTSHEDLGAMNRKELMVYTIFTVWKKG